MELYVVLLIMVAVGALIGGLTNSIAIKMLFRPYKAIYIGKWRVPFTPGLIPKRRMELAEQLGKLVVNHLLTADGLKQKLESASFVNEMTNWLQEETRKLLKSDHTVSTLGERWLGVSHLQERSAEKLDQILDTRIEMLFDELRPLQVKEVVPEVMSNQVENYIPELTKLFVGKSIHYFNSEEGTERLSNMVDRFLIGRGTLGNMISMFLGNERLVDKIQPEIIKMLNDEGTHELIEVFIRKEWGKLQLLTIAEIEEKIDLTNFSTFMKGKVKESIPLHYLHAPLHSWTYKYEDRIVSEIVPAFVGKVGQAISAELANLLKKLHLEDVVKNQVEQFAVERLEDIVLSISRKEFKLITILGALLGGMIGFIQGIFIIFLR